MDDIQLSAIPGMPENGTLTGLFSMEVTDGKPSALYIEDDFCRIVGLEPSDTPQQQLVGFFSRINAEGFEAIHFAVANCTKGLKAEAKFKWNHPLIGWIDVTCIGIHAEGSDNNYLVRGYFKSNMSQEAGAAEESDSLLLRNMLAEAMMDSFAVCGLCDLETNTVTLLKDVFNISAVLGDNFTYDQWRDTVSGLITREEVERFDEASTRKSLLHYFKTATDERKEEFRCLIPSKRKYRWMRIRFVSFKGTLASKYKHFFVFRDINENHHTEFKEAMRIKLINGLTLPYQIIDLVNLKTGRMYSSEVGDGKYAEEFDSRGFSDDALARYVYMCDCTDEERTAMFDKFLVNNMKRIFASGEKMIEAEVRHNNIASGKYEWVRIQAFCSAFDEDGNPLIAILTIQAINAEKEREISNKKRLEFALRSESQYKQAILSTAIAMYTYNVTTDTMYDEVIETEGISPLLPIMGMSCPCSYDEYINRKAELITTEAEAESFKKNFNTSALLDMFNSNRRSFDMEYEFMVKGRKGVFREAVILTKDLQTGEVWGLTYVKNVTHESEKNKRIEQALRDAFYQAQRANSAKTLFMSQMSHDIRTPLNSILGMAAIAQEHIDDRERVIDCMNKIEYSGRHLLELINNVLDLSSIESGKTQLATEEFDMRQFIEDTLKLVKPLTDKAGHTLEVKIGDMHTAVNGDHLKLRQLLMNVLGNAVKYTPQGGNISFTAEEIEPDRTDVSRYMFTVRDNGIGMSQEFLSKVFDPFVRADDYRTTRVEGTGLGMAIALNIARMMHGNITVNSEEGKGSVFEITVCLKRGEDHNNNRILEISMEEPVKPHMSDYDFGGIRVLLAEDLEFNAEIATEFLAEANIVTELAENGEEAVRMFSEAPEGYYRLIFMDLQMPLLDGLGATKRIRSLPRKDALSIPIIAMTANAFVDDIKEAKEAGMNGHIAKPLDISRLIAELKIWLGDHKKR